jgi:hypothetical protein
LWRTFAEGGVTLSEGGAVAMQTRASDTLTTTGTELTEGRHYWEVELLSAGSSCRPENICILIGISRPNLNPKGSYYDRNCTDGWFIYASSGCLFGNGKDHDDDDAAGAYNQSDRVGVLLDLNIGSLRFFKNGVQHGPGFSAGSVTGPVVAALQMLIRGSSVRLLPNAEAPANA